MFTLRTKLFLITLLAPNIVLATSKFERSKNTFIKETKIQQGLYLVETENKNCMEGDLEVVATDIDFRINLSSHPLVIALGLKQPMEENSNYCKQTFLASYHGNVVKYSTNYLCKSDMNRQISRTVEIYKDRIEYTEEKKVGDKNLPLLKCRLMKSQSSS